MSFFIELNIFLNFLLTLLGFRRSQKNWGTVYDSVTKQPLDPAQVKLIDVNSGKVIQSSITDLLGRYAFLAVPGKFKIFVTKTNYNFPSKLVVNEKDGIYENLYRGEFFKLSGDSEVISFNIPLDPQKADWNQQAKKKIIKSSPLGENLITRITTILFWFVFIMTLLSLYSSPSNIVYAVILFYLLVFILSLVLPKPRLWGRVVSKKSKRPLSEMLIELTHIKYPDVVIAKAVSFSDGKFFIRSEPGRYLLKFTKEDEMGYAQPIKTLKVKIGSQGVLNRTIQI